MRHEASRLPSAVFAVDVPNISGFLSEAGRQRDKKEWSLFAVPSISNDNTNCIEAAAKSLSAGGFGVYSPYFAFGLPQTLAEELLVRSRISGSGVRRLEREAYLRGEQ